MMKIGSFGMPSFAGFTISQITNGLLNIRNLVNVKLISLNPNQDLQDAENQHDYGDPTLQEYQVVMSDGECIYILAENLEQAAWDAWYISVDKDTKLVDVIQTNGRKKT